MLISKCEYTLVAKCFPKKLMFAST